MSTTTSNGTATADAARKEKGAGASNLSLADAIEAMKQMMELQQLVGQTMAPQAPARRPQRPALDPNPNASPPPAAETQEGEYEDDPRIALLTKELEAIKKERDIEKRRAKRRFLLTLMFSFVGIMSFTVGNWWWIEPHANEWVLEPGVYRWGAEQHEREFQKFEASSEALAKVKKQLDDLQKKNDPAKMDVAARIQYERDVADLRFQVRTLDVTVQSHRSTLLGYGKYRDPNVTTDGYVTRAGAIRPLD
jgi:hypothetical protein